MLPRALDDKCLHVMLFPLSKSFSATSIFQKGGEHHPAPASRTWQIDSSGSRERTQELHQLLTDQKPYSHHLAIIRRRADEGKRADVVRTRAHAEQVRAITQKQTQEMRVRRQNLRESIEKYNADREEGDDQMKRQMRDQQQKFVKWREDMEERVKTNPPIHGAPVKVESRLIRKGLHDEAQKTLKKQSLQYFKEMREFNESLSERKPQEWAPQPPPERKPSGAAGVQSTQREYEGFLEGIYRTHHSRVRDTRRTLAAETREIEERNEARAATSTRLATFGRGKLDAEEMQERLKTRPKTHGGYTPVVKSDKRMRNEEADKAGLGMAHSMSAPAMSAGESGG